MCQASSEGSGTTEQCFGTGAGLRLVHPGAARCWGAAVVHKGDIFIDGLLQLPEDRHKGSNGRQQILKEEKREMAAGGRMRQRCVCGVKSGHLKPERIKQ